LQIGDLCIVEEAGGLPVQEFLLVRKKPSELEDWKSYLVEYDMKSQATEGRYERTELPQQARALLAEE
jgi:hypothetical protein